MKIDPKYFEHIAGKLANIEGIAGSQIKIQEDRVIISPKKGQDPDKLLQAISGTLKYESEDIKVQIGDVEKEAKPSGKKPSSSPPINIIMEPVGENISVRQDVDELFDKNRGVHKKSGFFSLEEWAKEGNSGNISRMPEYLASSLYSQTIEDLEKQIKELEGKKGKKRVLKALQDELERTKGRHHVMKDFSQLSMRAEGEKSSIKTFLSGEIPVSYGFKDNGQKLPDDMPGALKDLYKKEIDGHLKLYREWAVVEGQHLSFDERLDRKRNARDEIKNFQNDINFFENAYLTDLIKRFEEKVDPSMFSKSISVFEKIKGELEQKRSNYENYVIRGLDIGLRAGYSEYESLIEKGEPTEEVEKQLNAMGIMYKDFQVDHKITKRKLEYINGVMKIMKKDIHSVSLEGAGDIPLKRISPEQQQKMIESLSVFQIPSGPLSDPQITRNLDIQPKEIIDRFFAAVKAFDKETDNIKKEYDFAEKYVNLRNVIIYTNSASADSIPRSNLPANEVEKAFVSEFAKREEAVFELLFVKNELYPNLDKSINMERFKYDREEQIKKSNTDICMLEKSLGPEINKDGIKSHYEKIGKEKGFAELGKIKNENKTKRSEVNEAYLGKIEKFNNLLKELAQKGVELSHAVKGGDYKSDFVSGQKDAFVELGALRAEIIKDYLEMDRLLQEESIIGQIVKNNNVFLDEKFTDPLIREEVEGMELRSDAPNVSKILDIAEELSSKGPETREYGLYGKPVINATDIKNEKIRRETLASFEKLMANFDKEDTALPIEVKLREAVLKSVPMEKEPSMEEYKLGALKEELPDVLRDTLISLVSKGYTVTDFESGSEFDKEKKLSYIGIKGLSKDEIAQLDSSGVVDLMKAKPMEVLRDGTIISLPPLKGEEDITYLVFNRQSYLSEKVYDEEAQVRWNFVSSVLPEASKKDETISDKELFLRWRYVTSFMSYKPLNESPQNPVPRLQASQKMFELLKAKQSLPLPDFLEYQEGMKTVIIGLDSSGQT